MPIETDNIYLWGRTDATPESFTRGGDSEPLHANPRKLIIPQSRISQRLPRFLWSCRIHNNEISCNLTAHLPVKHNKDNTKTPFQTWPSYPSTQPYTAQLPSYTGAPFAQPGKQCSFYQLDRSPESCAVQRQPVRTALPSQLTSEMLL